MAKARNRQYREDEERLNKRKVILTALAKATEDGLLPDEISASTDDTTNEHYYTLTQAEIEALISGDIQKIEKWASSLDRRHAIWLLSHLIKESF